MLLPKSLYENYTYKKFLEHESYIMAKYGQSAKQTAESYVNLALVLNDKKILRSYYRNKNKRFSLFI